MVRPEYPMAAVAGAEDVKLALWLLAVDPSLKGLLIRGCAGSGKSVLARSLKALLPSTSFIEAPATISEDRLLGGIDLGAMLAAGECRMSSGLLGRAHQGVLYMDEVNLATPAIAAHLAAALNSGVVRLEREGLSVETASSFVLVGAWDPREGEPARLLRDAVAFHAATDRELSLDERVEVACRALEFDADAERFVRGYSGQTGAARGRIHAARMLLPQVEISRESRYGLCESAGRHGVEGHRAEIFAARAARAHAALCGRRAVNGEDLAVAVRLVIEPRASVPSRSPLADAQGSAAPVPSRDREGADLHPGGLRKDSLSPARDRPGGLSYNGESAPCEPGGTGLLACPGAFPRPIRAGAVPSAAEFAAPPVDNPAPRLVEAGASRAGMPGRGKSRRAAASRAARGRYVRAIAADPGHGIVAIDATLRAAAGSQRDRRAASGALRIAARDLRFKLFRPKTGVEIVFALDASGSMAANRMQQAKGAVIRLLREAYVHRDRVALIGFRDQSATLLMKPGRAVELARRALDCLPAGGATPLASGLDLALDLARRSLRPVLLVLVTDGRANASSTGEPVWTELERAGLALRASGVVSLVIDTNRARLAGGEARRLAAILDARCVALPAMDGTAVYRSVAAMAAEMR